MIHPLLPILCLCLLPLPTRAADDKLVKPLATWLTQIQILAGKHRKGDTQAKTDAAFADFKAALAREHDGRKIQFTATIKDVKWKDGIATITTDAEYGKLPAPTPAAPLSLYRSHPFEVLMPHADALAIKAGTTLRFTGSVTFRPGQWLFLTTATKSQPLYTLRHEYLSNAYAGTFTSSDGRFQIKGKEYLSRWGKEPAASASTKLLP